MEEGLSRADFLRGKFSKRDGNRRSARSHEPAIRPPGAVPEARFSALCDGCEKCITSCPRDIISLDTERKAQLNVSPGPTTAEAGCIFCGACADACPTKALDPKHARPWLVIARLDPAACLSLGGIVCRTCGDVCDATAIRFQLMTQGRARPTIDPDACTGCGTCAALCPGKAIGLFDFHSAEPVAAKEATA